MSQSSSRNQPEIVLALQGGGALGAYQAGAYEAMCAAGHAPDRIAGISIGAVNGAIIAGNAPAERVAKLQAFWNRVSSRDIARPLTDGGGFRTGFTQLAALNSLLLGVPGFFAPRLLPPIAVKTEAPDDLSFYDVDAFAETLNDLIDFDRLNDDGPRLSVGAVNIETGNFAYFDSAKMKIDVRHVMASAALPPGFPPIEIDGSYYWDGGIVSNTPLHHIIDSGVREETIIFQVDLFCAHGPLPETLLDVIEREKDIRFSSRTRNHTRHMQERLAIHAALDRLFEKLPDDLLDDPDVLALKYARQQPPVSVLHVIYRDRAWRSHARDYEFSRASIRDHWDAGMRDITASLGHDQWRNRPPAKPGINIYDLTKDREGPNGT